MSRWILAAGLVALGGSVPVTFSRADRPENPRVTSCIAMPGWWLSPNGTRVFQVDRAGEVVDASGMPWNGCPGYPLGAYRIEGPPCGYRLTIPCGAQLEIVFVTSVSAILSARLVSSAGACSDTCTAWNAVALHPESTPVETPTWTRLKRLFR